MIDFRYHLVSIIAVFLALAVGLLVGVTALSGPAENLLQKELNRVSRANDSLHQTNRNLSSQVNADQVFAQAAASRLLGGLLTGQNVVVVTAPNADPSVTNGVTTALTAAGATVTGQVSLSSLFLDTSGHTENTLTTLAQQAQRQAQTAGVTLTLPSQPSNSAVAGQQEAAAVIAASLLYKDGPSMPTSVSQYVLSQFQHYGYLSMTGMPGNAVVPPPATMAVLVIPQGPSPSAINASDQALVMAAQQLRAAGRGAVMAGGVSAIGPGSAISAAAGQVTTVDNADTESGQIMVVWALLKDGSGPAKAFGVNPGAAPSPAPTPSPSDTTSTATKRSTSSGTKKTGPKK